MCNIVEEYVAERMAEAKALYSVFAIHHTFSAGSSLIKIKAG